MKTLLLILSIVAICTQSYSQSFVNGSLEGGAVPCNRVLNSQFPTFVGGAGFAFGTPNHGGFLGMIYFFDGSCGEGSAQLGSNFIGLAANDAGLVDAMSLKMTTPLLANKTYTLTFYMKKPKTTASIPLQIGYSNDSLAFGTLSDVVEAPTNQTWLLRTVHIRPTVTSKYVTIRAMKSNTGTFQYSYTYVDNFNVGPGVGVVSPEKMFALTPHPNPFTTGFHLQLSESTAFPCQLTLTDITGRTVYEQTSSSRDMQIRRGDLVPGIYLLNVRDADGVVAHSRIVAQ